MLIPNIQGFSFVVIGRNCHLILTIHYQDRYFLNINPCLSYFVSQCGTYSFMPGNKKCQVSKQKVPYNESKGFKYRDRENKVLKQPYQKD